MNILKFPSIASSILNNTSQYIQQKLSHIDENSSLPFLLETPILSQFYQHRFHPFLLSHN